MGFCGMENDFRVSTKPAVPYNEFESDVLNITAPSPGASELMGVRGFPATPVVYCVWIWEIGKSKSPHIKPYYGYPVAVRLHQIMVGKKYSLQWCNNGHNGVPNHQPHDCSLNHLFRHRSEKTSKLRVTGLCAENSPVTGEFPAQRSSNAEDISIWWRHHV